jgi:hypothetical protein
LSKRQATDLLPAELPAAVLEIPVELLAGADAPLVLDVPRIFAAGAPGRRSTILRLRQRASHRTCRSQSTAPTPTDAPSGRRSAIRAEISLPRSTASGDSVNERYDELVTSDACWNYSTRPTPDRGPGPRCPSNGRSHREGKVLQVVHRCSPGICATRSRELY